MLQEFGKKCLLLSSNYDKITNRIKLIINLKNRKQLKDIFSINQLQETITQILDLFMKIEGPTFWVSYLVPEDVSTYRKLMAPSNSSDELTNLMDVSKLEQLMSETRTILLRYAVFYNHAREFILYICFGFSLFFQ
jgi:hypothetical protein